MTRRAGRIGRVSIVALVALAIAACSSSNSSKPSPNVQSSTTLSAADALQAAKDATAKAEQGTNRPVDPTPRPAVKGKHVVVISQGEANISSQVPSDAARDAAKALGWQVDLYDAKLQLGSASAPLVRQAIAAHADGIILDAIDCQNVQAPLQEAKSHGIKVVAIYAYDCNDVKGGNAPEGLFSGQINFGPKAKDVDAFAQIYGADQARYIITDSNNTAKVIVIHDPEFVVLDWTTLGFENAIKASGGSTVVDQLDITAGDILNGQLTGKIQAEILRHPEATWIKSPYTFITTLGIVGALGANPNHLKVMGGEGFAPELDLVRQGKITAVNIISSEWTGWAAADTLNSLFRNEAPADSGIGWTIADKDHTVPQVAPGQNFAPPVDFKAAYKKAWGVS